MENELVLYFRKSGTLAARDLLPKCPLVFKPEGRKEGLFVRRLVVRHTWFKLGYVRR